MSAVSFPRFGAPCREGHPGINRPRIEPSSAVTQVQLVDLTIASWIRLTGWLQNIQAVQSAR
jgi:hypothetical protein